MAITKIHAIKSTLGKALAYIENPDKTDGQMLVSGYNCEPQTASIDFEVTAVLSHKARNLKRKRSTNLAYHLIQSFSPEDAVTPEQAHELGKKLAFEYTGGKYEYVVATHIDQLTDDTPANLIDYADEDVRSRENTKQMLKVAEDKLSTFLTENPDVEKETIENTEELPDPEILQLSEKQTQQRIDEIDAQLRGLRQERDKIRSTVESISIYEDSMNRIETEQEENEKKCSLAEKTLELLSQAKDNLANSYVGKVERGLVY